MARKRKTDDELFKDALAEPNETNEDTAEETTEETDFESEQETEELDFSGNRYDRIGAFDDDDFS